MPCVQSQEGLRAGSQSGDRNASLKHFSYQPDPNDNPEMTSPNGNTNNNNGVDTNGDILGDTTMPPVGAPDRDEGAMTYTDDMDACLNNNLGAAGVPIVGYRTGKKHPNDWHQENYDKYFNAFLSREEAEKVRNESKKTAAEVATTTDTTQNLNTKKFTQRINDIQFWKTELEREIKDIVDETERLIAQKDRLELSLYNTELPLHIASEALTNRQRRLNPDLVQDEPECSLIKEIQVINKVQDCLRRAIAQAEETIADLKTRKCEIEMDWSDKKVAHETDMHNSLLRNEDTNKQFYPGSANLQEKMSNPKSWAQFSHDNICRAENSRQVSVQLRQIIDNILDDISRDMRDQADVVERAIQKRIEETHDARMKLEDQLARTNKEINEQERNIAMLKQAIRDKEAPLKVAQTRLHNRNNGRPGVELCADDPQYGLIEEVNQINQSIDALMGHLNLAENSLKTLEHQRMSLYKEKEMKINTEFIENNRVAALRTRYPTIRALQGYNN